MLFRCQPEEFQTERIFNSLCGRCPSTDAYSSSFLGGSYCLRPQTVGAPPWVPLHAAIDLGIHMTLFCYVALLLWLNTCTDAALGFAWFAARGPWQPVQIINFFQTPRCFDRAPIAGKRVLATPMSLLQLAYSLMQQRELATWHDAAAVTRGDATKKSARPSSVSALLGRSHRREPECTARLLRASLEIQRQRLCAVRLGRSSEACVPLPLSGRKRDVAGHELGDGSQGFHYGLMSGMISSRRNDISVCAHMYIYIYV